MAHRPPKVVVPVGAMNSIATVEVHGPGHIGQAISRTAHVCGAILGIDPEPPYHRWIVPRACRNDGSEDRGLPHMSVQSLLRQVYLDPLACFALVRRDLGRRGGRGWCGRRAWTWSPPGRSCRFPKPVRRPMSGVRSTGPQVRPALDIGCPPAIPRRERSGGGHAAVAAAELCRCAWLLPLSPDSWSCL